MTQDDLIKAVSASANQSQAVVSATLKALAAVCQEAATTGEELTLPGICKISVTKREARIGRNPRTGESLEIPAKHVPKFTALKALKDAASNI